MTIIASYEDGNEEDGNEEKKTTKKPVANSIAFAWEQQ